jgi:hypothetical protein
MVIINSTNKSNDLDSALIFDYLNGNYKSVKNHSFKSSILRDFFITLLINKNRGEKEIMFFKDYINSINSSNSNEFLENWLLGYCFEQGIIFEKDLSKSAYYYLKLSNIEKFLNILRLVIFENLDIKIGILEFDYLIENIKSKADYSGININSMFYQEYISFDNEKQKSYYNFLLASYCLKINDYTAAYYLLKYNNTNIYSLRKLILLSEYFVKPDLYGFDIYEDNDFGLNIFHATQKEENLMLEPYEYYFRFLELNRLYDFINIKDYNYKNPYKTWFNNLLRRSYNGSKIAIFLIGLIYNHSKDLNLINKATEYLMKSYNEGSLVSAVILKSKKLIDVETVYKVNKRNIYLKYSQEENFLKIIDQDKTNKIFLELDEVEDSIYSFEDNYPGFFDPEIDYEIGEEEQRINEAFSRKQDILENISEETDLSNCAYYYFNLNKSLND